MTHKFEMNAPDSPRICRHCGKAQDACTGVDTMPEETREHMRATLELLTLGAAREIPDWKEALVALDALRYEIRKKLDGHDTAPDPIALPDFSDDLTSSINELAESSDIDDPEEAEDFVDSWTRAFRQYAHEAVVKDRLDRRVDVADLHHRLRLQPPHALLMRVAEAAYTKGYDLAEKENRPRGFDFVGWGPDALAGLREHDLPVIIGNVMIGWVEPEAVVDHRTLTDRVEALERAEAQRVVQALPTKLVAAMCAEARGEDPDEDAFDPDDPRFVELHDRLTAAGSFPQMSASEGHELSDYIQQARDAARAARAR